MLQPTTEEIVSLKALHGRLWQQVHADRTFVLKAIDRATHLELQKKVLGESIAQQSEVVMNADQAVRMEEETVKAAVVWPVDQTVLTAEAGTIPALFQRILAISGFVAPEEPVEL